MTASGRASLCDRVALITGASRGIGAAIARLFAAEGAEVIVNGRDEERLRAVADGIRRDGGKAGTVVADIGDANGVETLIGRALERAGHIDVLVHNAGIFPYRRLEEMDDACWQTVMDVNLTSALRLTRGCLPSMKSRGGGRILFTSSVQGNRAAVPGCAHYAASKAGLTGLVRAAALELAPYRITVNSVEPGLIRTAGVEQALSPERRTAMAQYVPLKRWGEADDVAWAMRFLASDEAAYITGQSIIVDGGALLPQNGAFMV